MLSLGPPSTPLQVFLVLLKSQLQSIMYLHLVPHTAMLPQLLQLMMVVKLCANSQLEDLSSVLRTWLMFLLEQLSTWLYSWEALPQLQLSLPLSILRHIMVMANWLIKPWTSPLQPHLLRILTSQYSTLSLCQAHLLQPEESLLGISEICLFLSAQESQPLWMTAPRWSYLCPQASPPQLIRSVSHSPAGWTTSDIPAPIL